MSPSVIILIATVAGALSCVGYSYHLGRTQGDNVCHAEKLASQLKVKELELQTSQSLSELQQKEIGEAQAQLEQERNINAELNQKLTSLPLSKHPDCIPDSVLNSIREFRRKARSGNS